MEGTDVFASVIASFATAWNGRNRDERRRDDGGVCAILEHDAITPVIVSIVCLEGRGIK